MTVEEEDTHRNIIREGVDFGKFVEFDNRVWAHVFVVNSISVGSDEHAEQLNRHTGADITESWSLRKCCLCLIQNLKDYSD